MQNIFRKSARSIKRRTALVAGILAIALLVTQSALAVAPDALWCPNGGICANYETLQQAVDAAKAAHTPGTIWADPGVFAETVTVDGLKDLTITGNPSTISGSLIITKSKNIKVNNFTVLGPYGINVTKGSGAYSFVSTVAALQIESSMFKGSPTHGLLINGHSGTIALNKVTAQSNVLDGVRISNPVGSSVVSVTQSKFQKNGDTGLRIASNAQIYVGAVSALKNGDDGVLLDTAGEIIVQAYDGGKNKFDGNAGNGLQANSDDKITVSATSASKNGDMGLQLVNDTGTADIFVGSFETPSKYDSNGQAGLFIQTAGDATVRRFSASKNKSWGMTVLSDGDITVTDAIVSKNGTNGGAILVNYTGTGSVTVSRSYTKMSRFDGNKGVAGLSILSDGPIVLTDVSASKNVNARGVQASTGGGIILLSASTTNLNHFDGNTFEGLHLATTTSTVFVLRSTASSNGKGGAYDGAHVTTSNGHATFQCGTFNKNTGNGIDTALGTGSLTLNGVIATANGQTDIISSDLTPTVGVCP